MRILMISTYYEPDIASTGVIMTQLAEELSSLGHQVRVVSTMPHYSENQVWEEYRGKLFVKEERNGVQVLRLFTFVRRDKNSFFGRMLNYWVFNFGSLIAGVLLPRPHVVFSPSPPLTNGLVADLISRIRRVPFVYNVQDIWPGAVIRAGVLKNRTVIRLLEWMERYVYRRAKALAVISRGFQELLAGKGVAVEKITVIENCFDTDLVKPGPKANRFSREHDLDRRFVVHFGGNLGHAQAIEVVIKAAERLRSQREIKFLIVGDGAARGGLEDLVRELKLPNVLILPFQPKESLPEIYAAADVSLVTLGKGFSEDCVPCKVYTIMSAGKAMIASIDENSDTWELLGRVQCAVRTEIENPEALADAVLMLFREPALAARLGANGRSHVVENNTPEIIVHRYEQVFERVIEASSQERR